MRKCRNVNVMFGVVGKCRVSWSVETAKNEKQIAFTCVCTNRRVQSPAVKTKHAAAAWSFMH